MSQEPAFKRRRIEDPSPAPPSTLTTVSDPMDIDAKSPSSTQADLSYDNEFSRLIGTLGKDALKRLQASKILLVGVGGLGIEIAKNIVLMGVASLTLHDTAPVAIEDLSAHFFLSPESVGKNRAEVSVARLTELNERVKISVNNATLDEKTLSEYTTVVVTNSSSRAELIRINDICHNHKISFIAGEVRGLFGFIFNDFGTFTCIDSNGEPPLTSYVESITKANPGVVTVVDTDRHELEDGQIIRLTEVQGMTELNGHEHKITVTGPYTFSIGDTSAMGDYVKGGFVEEIKVPAEHNFEAISSFFGKPLPHDKVSVSDWAKFDRCSNYHYFLQALLQYQEQKGSYPTPGSSEEAAAVASLAQEIATASAPEGETPTFDEKTTKWMTLLAKGSQGVISPMATIFGGIIGQEIIKATSSKYTPIKQFLYFDALECLPSEELTTEDCAPRGTRYDGQIAVFGNEFNEKVLNLNYFLVGAGAIGCEVLKCWAMMGLSAGPNGSIHVTDMDTIEISNLNRQFLYRPWDVTKFKSETSAAAAQVMNPELKITPWSVRVGPDTETTYDADFWGKLSGVCNALDNVKARLYMDQRCVFYQKSLLESGTQGTKGNTQVIVPFLTESYGSSVDPPAKETPVCLLHSFPNNIQHCMQWARELCFEGSFVKDADINNNYIETEGFVDSLAPTLRLSTLQTLKATMLDRPKTFEECVEWARLEFEDKFGNAIKQLLYTFPKDYVDKHGTPFWSGAKRPPTPIVFDAENELHLDYIVSASFLKAFSFGILKSEFKPADLEEKKQEIKKTLSKVTIPEFKPKSGVKIETDMKVTKVQASYDDKDEETCTAILADLPAFGSDSLSTQLMNPVDFEKDDDNNFHIDFIHACSNLRASAYGIPQVNRLKTKLIAGKIIPAIVTTTAACVGFVNLELYKLVSMESKKLEDFRNSFMNLAIPIFSQSEPIAPKKQKYLNTEFSLWDRIDIRIGDATLQEVLDYFRNEHKLDVEMLGVGQSLLYAAWAVAKAKTRLPKKITQIYEEITQTKIDREHQKYLMLEPTALDLEGNDVEDIPLVALWF
eukprot:TRINITY_DN256_c0_g2_i1.p1 TRINITY_DN256_c0_g2~~TRINITY_DN256_c0_g2_i1.p1  ORF type:complete len:1063 (-),score=334.92 TRINITY_DN256_c0_g2_i1:80-3268(-)